MKTFADIRREYSLKTLDKSSFDKNPIGQFQQWLKEAVEACVHDPTAMTLATSTPEGKPSARVVLLKKVDERGFIFYTNYNSRKAVQLKANPYAALVFYWPDLERQVRVEGISEKLSESESDEYFLSRPEGSRIGAWASPQSQVIPDRAFLESNVLRYEKQFNKALIPRPEHWGGFCIKPYMIEFWQGRANRLHDRIQYTLQENDWKSELLAP